MSDLHSARQSVSDASRYARSAGFALPLHCPLRGFTFIITRVCIPPGCASEGTRGEAPRRHRLLEPGQRPRAVWPLASDIEATQVPGGGARFVPFKDNNGRRAACMLYTGAGSAAAARLPAARRLPHRHLLLAPLATVGVLAAAVLPSIGSGVARVGAPAARHGVLTAFSPGAHLAGLLSLPAAAQAPISAALGRDLAELTPSDGVGTLRHIGGDLGPHDCRRSALP
jgi:hypothetical protein